MERLRDQFEYDKWRKIEKELDEALWLKSLEPVKDWDIASELNDTVTDDLMEAALREKLVLAR
ncbi:16093_t:CDS:2 [Cetraspora pellucida]|uniref:16093_t:CDS:1 n=1 Tax=Cetraspora pellucida TaxID=1433469 RepID=A0ACA9M9E1_9GLOM|nr:16093_t:CDS:2 [Cetraspora pellucida]